MTSKPDARTRLTLLREKLEPDETAQQNAAQQIVQDLRRAARQAKCEVETSGELLVISLPNVRAVVKVQAVEGRVCVWTGSLVVTHDAVQGLTFDPVECQFSTQDGTTPPVDVVADLVATKLEKQLREIGHPVFK
jgi:hypothetical protein